MIPEKMTFWTWPDRDHNAAVANSMCDCDLNEWKTRLAYAVEYIEKCGSKVNVVTIPVQDMLDELKKRGIDNSPNNRALIAVEWRGKK